MNRNYSKKLLAGLAVGFLIASTPVYVGCAPKKVVAVYDNKSDSEHSKVGHEHGHKRNGPPAHAPAHGYRAKHQYRYYPSRSVYYDTGRKLYFYIKGDHWEASVSLPYPIRNGLGNSVSIELDTDKPYIYHSEHVKKYPPGQMKHKKNKKNKWG